MFRDILRYSFHMFLAIGMEFKSLLSCWTSRCLMFMGLGEAIHLGGRLRYLPIAVLMLFVLNVLLLVFSALSVGAVWSSSVPIYIRADGGVEPSNAPVRREGNRYIDGLH